MAGDPNRTLVIETVDQRDGELVAQGQVGRHRKGPRRDQHRGQWERYTAVDSIRHGANARVRLDLTAANERPETSTLAGSAGSSQHGNERSLKLDRKQ